MKFLFLLSQQSLIEVNVYGVLMASNSLNLYFTWGLMFKIFELNM